MLRLVHLSDIHFSNRKTAIGYDPDEDVRREVVRDLAERVKKDGPCNAILVTGDIAFSGKKSEYDDARVWLESVRETAKCPRKMIFLCPGNHDVDRDIHKNNGMIKDVHSAIISEADQISREKILIDRLSQSEGARMLYAPLEAFNEFAASFASSFYADEDSFAWNKDIPLNDGSRLRIRSMNSALLSYDDGDRNKLLLSSRAWTMNREEGVVYLAMAHHPPAWLADEHDANAAISDRAILHLFGHEHNARVVSTKHWCRVFAGSINPERDEPNWAPGYNILNIDVETSVSGIRHLNVAIDVREWKLKPEAKFETLADRDGEEYHRAVISLPEWTPPEPVVDIIESPLQSMPIAESEPDLPPN